MVTMSIKLLIRLSCLIFVSSVECDNTLMPQTENYFHRMENLAECIFKLSTKYFSANKGSRALSGNIIIININTRGPTTKRQLLKIIHRELKYSLMLKDSSYRHANASRVMDKAKNYLMILDEKRELKRNLRQLCKLPTWNPLAKAIVFYQLKTNEDAEQTAIDFINELREFKFLKSTVFLNTGLDEEVISYTWSPYSDTNCGGKCESVYILDKCKDNVLHEIERQREILPFNMKGCPLIAYAVVSEPYVMPPLKKITHLTFDDVYEFQKGIEIKALQIISQFTNMSLIVRMSETAENWGTILPNGTATGAYDVLRNDAADLVIGNIEVTKTLRTWFDPTKSYTQDEITWCVPKAGQASTWDNLFIVFEYPTWITLLACSFIMGFTFHYLYYREHGQRVTKWPTESLLLTFQLLLGWGSSFEPKTTAFRILIFSWLVFSLYMRISYESSLRGFLIHPRFEKQIATQQDLIGSKICFGGRETYRSHFEATNTTWSLQLYRKYNSVLYDEGIRRAAFDRDFAVVSSRRQAKYQNQKLGKGAPLIYCFSETNNIYKYRVVLLCRKWFPMLDRFNRFIQTLRETGLLSKWNAELLRTTTAKKTSDAIPLGTRHLLGAFVFIGFMYAANVLVFIVELSFFYIRR